MVPGIQEYETVGIRTIGDRDRVLLEAFSRRAAYWTTDLALLVGYRSIGETYRALERLEQRHLVHRVVRLDPISWRRTELGDMVVQANAVDEEFRFAS
jgi:hypothetical protein